MPVTEADRQFFAAAKTDPRMLPLFIETKPSLRYIPISPSYFNLNSIDIYTNLGCNKRCKHCFLSDQQLSSKEVMSMQMFDQILDWAKQDGSTINEVTLLGGESALHPDFKKMVKRADEKGFKVRVVTNGTTAFREALNDPEIADIFRKSHIAVSLESADQSINDDIRGRGSFQDAQTTIAELRAKEIPFDINCTLMRHNAASLQETIRFAENEGARRINIHSFSAVGRGESYPRRLSSGEDQQLSVGEWRDILEDSQQYTPRSPDFIIDYEQRDSGFSGENVYACAVRDATNLQFCPDGAVMSCGLFMPQPEKSAYVFMEGQLFQRKGRTENTITSETIGCPWRGQEVCIYERLNNTAHIPEKLIK